MIAAALVSHGQDLAGTPLAEIAAAAGFVLTSAQILNKKGAGQL